VKKSALLGCGIWFCLILGSAYAQGPAAGVVLSRVNDGVVAEHAEMIGTLYFETAGHLSVEEGGRVLSVHFREGDKVKKGDVLLRLDSRVLETQLGLQRARLAQLDVRMEHSRKNLDRYTELFRKEATSEATYDELRFTYAGLEKEREAQLREIEILKIRLEKYEIRAPFDGLVLEKSVDVGDWSQPGQPFCRLGKLDELFVQVAVAESVVRFAEKGARLPVLLHAYAFEGTGVMEGIRPVADPKTKNVVLRLRFPYTGPLAENMSVTVRVPVSEKRAAILAPRDALVRSPGGDGVYVIEEGKALFMPVTVLTYEGRQMGLLANGLKSGMSVVVEGNERLRPGQAVSVRGER
jgi:RND family efflux transporter MFP subunit